MAQSIKIATRQDIIKIGLPEKTESYTPIAHEFCINTILEQADKAGLVLNNEEYLSAKEGKMIVGNLNFHGYDDGMGIRMSFKNSYDKSRAFGIACGSNVWICMNGCMSGGIQYTRIHTGELCQEEIYSNIVQTVQMSAQEYAHKVNFRDRFREIKCEKDIAHELVARLFFEEQLIGSKQMNIIKDGFDGKIGKFTPIDSVDFSVWDFYNHVTESFKTVHPDNYIETHVKFHEMVEKEYNELILTPEY